MCGNDDKMSILVCTDKLEKFSLPHQNHELKLMSRVETENGPISRGSQSGVSMVKDL